MTSVLDRVDQISAQARQVQVARLLLTVLAVLFWVPGWLAARVFTALIWCAVAVKVGWMEGRKPHGSSG